MGKQYGVTCLTVNLVVEGAQSEPCGFALIVYPKLATLPKCNKRVAEFSVSS